MLDPHVSPEEIKRREVVLDPHVSPEEIKSREVVLDPHVSPEEIKSREVVLDPHVSPEEIKSREVELGSESWTSFALVVIQHLQSGRRGNVLTLTSCVLRSDRTESVWMPTELVKFRVHSVRLLRRKLRHLADRCHY